LGNYLLEKFKVDYIMIKTAAVVGAGIMGSLMALGLKSEGWEVTLFDSEAWSTNCSHAAAGLLAPMSELDKSDAIIFNLGITSVESLWPKIIHELSDLIYFRQQGCLVVHHPQDKTEWQCFSSRIINKLSKSCYELLDHSGLMSLEPELTSFNTAYYFHKEAQLDNQAVLSALKNYLIDLGVLWHHAQVSSIEPGLVKVEKHVYSFDMVFDCRGLGAKNTFSSLRGLRGELIWLHAPEVRLQRPVRLLHPRYNIYIVPRPNFTYLIGASELESEDFSAISVRTTLELLTAAYSVHRGFSEARLIKTVTQCRPTLTHHLPRIKYTKQLIAVNGLYRHGYLIAPALVKEILCGLKSNQKEMCYPELWEVYT
jgi:glycine oxidase